MSIGAATASSSLPGRADPAAGRVAIVTGAAGDIGRAIVRRFLDEGLRLTVVDIDAARLEAAFGGDPTTRERVLRIACDIADADACRDTVAATVERFGALECLVNNAAIVTPAATPAELSVEDWERALKVNLTAAFLFSKWSIPHMKAANKGVVINIASQLGHVAAPGRSAYSVTKAGLLALTRSIAIDHAADGIRAVSVSPGSVLTSRLVGRDGSADAVRARLEPLHPVGRLGTPDEVAASVQFLASDAAAFITGTDLLVDGGYTAR